MLFEFFHRYKQSESCFKAALHPQSGLLWVHLEVSSSDDVV